MGRRNVTIGDAELEIMKVLWKAGTPLNSQEIGRAVADKGWKRTTISTFLTRLTEKGALKSEKKGNVYYYAPGIGEKSYKRAQTRRLIQTLFDGSAHDFAVSLFEEEDFTKQDIEELRALFDGKEG